MTDETIHLITAAVSTALKPELDALHGRVTEVAKTVSAIDERTAHMPTQSDMHLAVASHASSCGAKRRWSIGVVLGLPALAAALTIVIKAL